MANRMLAGKYLRIEEFRINFNFSLDNAQIIFSEKALLVLITEGKVKKS